MPELDGRLSNSIDQDINSCCLRPQLLVHRILERPFCSAKAQHLLRLRVVSKFDKTPGRTGIFSSVFFTSGSGFFKCAAFDQGYVVPLIMNRLIQTEAGKASAPSARTFPRATSRTSTIQFGAKGAPPRLLSWWMKPFVPMVATDVGRGNTFAYKLMI